jgi:hypothetical protein
VCTETVPEKLITIKDSNSLIQLHKETEIVIPIFNRIHTDNEDIVEEISLPANRRKSRINANCQYDEESLL